MTKFKETFSSLSVRNYRLYFIGMSISNSGFFMQVVALAWLVLRLTGSGTVLGIVTALQFLPVLLISMFGGLIADRFSKRKILYVTQSLLALSAFVLGALVVTNTITLLAIYIIALFTGLVNAFDTPARHSFTIEMVGKSKLRNAVILAGSAFNVTRIIGPAIAGILIATVGVAVCFFVNALSYLAIIASLLMMDAKKLYSPKPVRSAKGRLYEGLQYAVSNSTILTILIMMAITGTLTYEYQISFPLMAEFAFHSGAAGYAALFGAFGIGAIAGGLLSAGSKNTSMRLLIALSSIFGLAVIIASIMPNLASAMAAFFFMGFASLTFSTLASSMLQLESKPQMRGRVMSLWTICMIGSTAVGGPIIGYIGDHAGPRWALATGGIAAIAAAIIGLIMLRKNLGSKKKAKKLD